MVARVMVMLVMGIVMVVVSMVMVMLKMGVVKISMLDIFRLFEKAAS